MKVAQILSALLPISGVALVALGAAGVGRPRPAGMDPLPSGASPLVAIGTLVLLVGLLALGLSWALARLDR